MWCRGLYTISSHCGCTSVCGESVFVISLLTLADCRRNSCTSKPYKIPTIKCYSYFTLFYPALSLIHMLQAKISAPQLVSSGACAPFMRCLRQQIGNVSSYTLHWRYFCFLLISWKLQDSILSGGKGNDGYYCPLLCIKIGRKDETGSELSKNKEEK